MPVVGVSGFGLEHFDERQAEVIRPVHLQRRFDAVALNGAMRMDFDVKLAAALVIDRIPLGPGLRCHIALQHSHAGPPSIGPVG
jgi:hypothetical protein